MLENCNLIELAFCYNGGTGAVCYSLAFDNGFTDNMGVSLVLLHNLSCFLSGMS